MTIIEALQNALDLLEANGYKSGDVHDDLELAINRISRKHSGVANEQL